MVEIPLNDLLKCAVQVVGRIAMRPEQVGEIVMVSASARQLKAYNLCDGTKTQGEVAKAAGLDAGNFSRTASRWVESGVLFRIGSGKDARLLHLYPLVKINFKQTQKRKAAGKRKRKGRRHVARKQGARKRQGR
jgi:hypothetical protein